jgi:hypothetical protein
MMKDRLGFRYAALLGIALGLLWVQPAPALPAGGGADQQVQIAQAGGTEPRELEPRYQPAPVQEKSWYNDSYIFGMTRGVAESTMHPAAKVPLFVLTVPLDLVFLPFAALGGMFG